MSMDRFAKPATPSSPASGSGGGGQISSAAEIMANALENPGVETNKLLNVGRVFDDWANGHKVYASGIDRTIAWYQEHYPEDTATVEQLAGIKRQMMAIADEIESAASTHRLRSADDLERIQAPRVNEIGRDYGTNRDLA